MLITFFWVRILRKDCCSFLRHSKACPIGAFFRFLGDSWNARRKPKTLNCQENWELWGIAIAKPFLVLNKMGTLDEHKYWLIKSNESLHLVQNLCKKTRCPLTLHQCLHRWQASFKTCHLFSYRFYSYIKFSSITILKQFMKLSFNKFNMIWKFNTRL